MLIRHMTATYGKLHNSELNLSPGLNLIYAPNESGKTTWSKFICAMFYGLSTRERGTLADKNRFAPWDCSSMQGKMEISTSSRDYTIIRTTRRPTAPMGDFSCTYRGTTTDVPDLNAQNCAEHFLGISREIFQRTAFISQGQIPLDYNSQLEQRISSLITAGEEDISYQDAYDRLKKQLHIRRSSSKNGKIPALEQEVASSLRELDMIREVQSQEKISEKQLSEACRQLEDLKYQSLLWQQQAQWQQHQRCQAARHAAEEAALRANQVMRQFHPLPDETQLLEMEQKSAVLQQGALQCRDAQRVYSAACASHTDVQAQCQQHPLYPATEVELQSPCAAAPTPPRPYICILLLTFTAILFLFTRLSSSPFLLPSTLICGISSLISYLLYRKKCTAHRQNLIRQQSQRAQDIDSYLCLLRQTAESESTRDTAALYLEKLQQQQQETLLDLLTSLRPYFPDAMDVDSIVFSLQELRRRCNALAKARQEAQEANFRYTVLREQQGDLPDFTSPPLTPSIRRELIAQLMPQAEEQIRSIRSRLDVFTGRLQALGSEESIRQRLSQQQKQLSQLQSEYDAISLAMEVLEQSNTQLQNRFSPALGARTAEIFQQLTAGRYGRVLLNRDFSLSVEVSGDLAPHDAQLLSHGAGDQLYLALRLALCDTVLSTDSCPPLILDDALMSFDDERLHLALDYLLELSRHRQILLFTCHKREAAYLSGREGVTCLAL